MYNLLQGKVPGTDRSPNFPIQEIGPLTREGFTARSQLPWRQGHLGHQSDYESSSQLWRSLVVKALFNPHRRRA
eukprot:3906066-Rhodomonas_salina.3